MDPHMFDSEFSYELYIFSILNLYLTVKHVWPIICATHAFNLQEQRRFKTETMYNSSENSLCMLMWHVYIHI